MSALHVHPRSLRWERGWVSSLPAPFHYLSCRVLIIVLCFDLMPPRGPNHTNRLKAVPKGILWEPLLEPSLSPSARADAPCCSWEAGAAPSAGELSYPAEKTCLLISWDRITRERNGKTASLSPPPPPPPHKLQISVRKEGEGRTQPCPAGDASEQRVTLAMSSPTAASCSSRPTAGVNLFHWSSSLFVMGWKTSAALLLRLTHCHSHPTVHTKPGEPSTPLLVQEGLRSKWPGLGRKSK